MSSWSVWSHSGFPGGSDGKQSACNISSVPLPSRVRLFATPWIAACQASLFITNSWSLLKLMPIESVMPSSHLILCRPLLLLPPIPPSIRVFSSESTLHMRWPKYWSFSFRKLPYFSLNTASEGVWDPPTSGCLISMFPSTCEQTYVFKFPLLRAQYWMQFFIHYLLTYVIFSPAFPATF